MAYCPKMVKISPFPYVNFQKIKNIFLPTIYFKILCNLKTHFFFLWPNHNVFLLQALQELQGKMITTTQQLKLSDAQIETLKRSMQHSALVEKELSRLPDDIKVYEGVGRM